MIETYIRKHVQPLFDFIAHKCIARGAHANGITLFSLITGLLAAGAIATGYLMSAFVLLMLSGLCDILDGSVARITRCSTPFGAYCDLIADRMVESAIIIGFAMHYPEHLLAYLFFFAAVMLHFSTFVLAGTLFSNTGNKSMHYDASIIERAEAFIVFFAMLMWPNYIFIFLMLLNAVIFFDGISRFMRVKKMA